MHEVVGEEQERLLTAERPLNTDRRQEGGVNPTGTAENVDNTKLATYSLQITACLI